MTRVVCSVKDQATQDLLQPAGATVESAMLSNNITAMPCPSLPQPDNFQRTANRVRQQTRPEEPRDLEFELVTAYQLDKLATARRWYIDRTFPIVQATFIQLVSIHAFLQQNGEMKQVPLVFVLMSGKKKIDYD